MDRINRILQDLQAQKEKPSQPEGWMADTARGPDACVLGVLYYLAVCRGPVVLALVIPVPVVAGSAGPKPGSLRLFGFFTVRLVMAFIAVRLLLGDAAVRPTLVLLASL